MTREQVGAGEVTRFLDSTDALDRFVTHSTILEFAADRVNLGRDDVKEYREQVNRMREKLERYIAEHPERLPLMARMAEDAKLATRTAAEVAIRACAHLT